MDMLRLERGLSVAMLTVILFASLPMAASATPVTFTSASAFDAAAPGLPLETFETALVAASSVTVCTGALSSASGSGCFPAGGLLSGVTYGNPGETMAVLGANFSTVGNTSKVLGPNFFADTFNITFSGAPNAVGMNVFAGTSAANVQLSFFSPTNVSLGVFSVFAPLGGTFFGLISDSDSIGRINVDSLGGNRGELIDNLRFGTATNVVPEPASLALVGTGLIGTVIRRYRKRH
jgi:PEP-CTERM motif